MTPTTLALAAYARECPHLNSAADNGERSSVIRRGDYVAGFVAGMAEATRPEPVVIRVPEGE